ncbi:MAG: hypothetical protein E7620_05410 [Ruminococcaceae bacterium]|nr:hypothetical protein [Oscillospiraceae bacterium]
MTEQYSSAARPGLSSSTLKILACALMAIDHIGVRWFPDWILLRVIGRSAFPIFAFFIAEGCRYSKHKVKRFFTIFGMGAAFFLCYYLYTGEEYANIFLTFSVSILLIHLLQLCKRVALGCSNPLPIAGAFLLFALALLGAYLLFSIVTFEYRFCGMLTPVLVSLFDFRGMEASPKLRALDNHPTRLFCLTVGLLAIAFDEIYIQIQIWSLAALLPLALYNGQVGRHKMKYAFYLFYPLHLLIIEGGYILYLLLTK